MYGQGSHGPQFRQGPPVPPPPFQQAPFGQPPPFQQLPPPPIQQFPSGPPPLIYQHGPLPRQPYIQPPSPAQGSAPMVPSYSQPGPPYPSMMLNQNAHYALQPMPPPLRMLPPPPPPPSQGQVLYRIPPPPPPEIQHVPTPPPPPPSGFVSITPAPLAAFSHTSRGDAQLPALPPPPPPSSPPPLPPSPPPPTSPTADFPDLVPEEPSTDSKDKVDAQVASIHKTDSVLVHGDDTRGAVGDTEEKVLLVEGEESAESPSPPQMPVEKEVVQNIEVLCHFILKAGPDFENLARTKEAGNPHFAFLFGGEPGTAAAIGHAYFQWMKRKYQFEMKSGQDLEQIVPPLRPSEMEISSQYGNLEDEDTISDMDMEDVSPVRASPDAADYPIEDNVKGYVRASTGEFGLVKLSPAAAGGKIVEIPRVFVKDRSPFRLIQGYASDDSEEDDKRENVGDISPIRASPTAASGLHEDKGFELYSNFKHEYASLTEVGSELPPDSRQPLTSSVPIEAGFVNKSSPHRSTSPNINYPSLIDPSKEVVDHNIPQQDEKILVNTMGEFKLSQDSETAEGDSSDVDRQAGKLDPQEDAKKDSAVLDVDEFGRLIRKGASDSDSDGMQRGRSLSRRRSPQESRWRQRNHSPRGDERNRSPRLPRNSRSKSPPPFRRTNVFPRRERDQPPECFNFIRGRCFRGASCRFLHRDFHQERPHDAKIGKTEMNFDECKNVPQEENKHQGMQDRKELSKASTKAISSVALDEKDEPEHGGGMREATKVDPIEEDQTQPEHVGRMREATKVDPIEEPLLESSHPLGAGSVTTQPSPSGKIQPLLNKTLAGQPNSGAGTSGQHSQVNAVSTTISEQSQIISHYPHVEGHILHPLTVQTIQSTTFHNQTPETPYLDHAPTTRTNPIQTPVTQPYPNYAPSNQSSDQPLVPKEFPAPRSPTPAFNLQPSQLLPSAPQGHPSPLFPSDNTSAPFVSQHPRENLLPPVLSQQQQLPQSQTFPYHGPLIASDYHYHRVPPPPNPAWANLSPSAPSNVTALPSRPAFPSTDFPLLHFQQNAMPPKSAFIPQPAMRPTPIGELTRPQVLDIRTQPFHSAGPSQQPPLYLDEVRRMPLPVGNQQNKSFGREDWFPHPRMPGQQIDLDSHRVHHLRHQPFLHEEVRASFRGQGFNFSSPFAHGGTMHPQSLPFQRGPLPNKPQSFPGDLPPRFLPRVEFPTAGDLSHQPPYGQQHPAGSNVPSNFSTPDIVDTSTSRYSSSFPENNMPPHLSDTGLRKMPFSAHYNPYASTFEQTPASLLSGSGGSGRDSDGNINRFDSSFSSGHVPVGRPASIITASPPNSRRSGEPFWPKSGFYPPETSAELLPDVPKQFVRERATGDTYDPLFDSIEPSSITFKKLDLVQENLAISEGGTMQKTSCLHEPAVVKNNSQKEGVAAELKSEADELGEVATDAEVGAVENGSPQLDEKDWSPGVPFDVGNAAAGEIEMVQVRSPKKSKKSKDSKSMKLFKVALADFVKEVLKPSWRQGNMSKEAFKTIVKKTVDKVSGAMPSHQVPKSQVKINQYVESSQRKLTKLVMGYVDKYVKS